ncbi:MAG: hypothetical protein MUO26_07770 [Methanotrichaceae archaeon]|nr:hypothetical protein [Methanotrichaceae archaeon]
MPDLRITGAVGSPVFGINESLGNPGMQVPVYLPLTVLIYNQGSVASGPFKISLHLIDEIGKEVQIPFTVPNEENIWTPGIDSLVAGKMDQIGGLARISSTDGQPLYGRNLKIRAVVDSCAGEEFAPEFCHVQESDENNNEVQISINLPHETITANPLPQKEQRKPGMLTPIVTPSKAINLEENTDRPGMNCPPQDEAPCKSGCQCLTSAQAYQLGLGFIPDCPVDFNGSCCNLANGELGWCYLSISLEDDVDRPGMNYKNFDLQGNQDNPEFCSYECVKDPNCKAFTYVKPGFQGLNARCWLKNGVPDPLPSNCCISGVK